MNEEPNAFWKESEQPFKKELQIAAAHNKPRYIRVWRNVLADWLGWSDKRVAKFISGWEADLDGRGGLVYHENAIHWVVGRLISKRLEQKLKAASPQDSRAVLRFSWRLADAIQSQSTGNPENDDFDWEAARRRVDAVLSEYGEKLASSNGHSS
jgi:hypothetical protein